MTLSIVLASASEGRSQLLRRAGVPFTVEPSMCSEDTEVTDPEEHVRILALRKASEVARRYTDAIVMGADTIIVLDGEILGKPASASAAASMLSRLTGRSHQLMTGLAIIDASSARHYVGVETTDVHMRHLSQEQIRAYVASGEPMGKSGSYEIQGLGATIIDWIHGDFANVIGLPMAHLSRALEEFGIRIP